ncbi:MAG: G8 domain-containing protein, partial [Anaerolineales bacterium]
MRRLIGTLTVALLCTAAAAPVISPAGQGPPPPLASVRSGRWSDPAIWQGGRVPAEGAAVVIAAGTRVEYDIASGRELASLDVHGTLLFSRSRSTRLDTGNVIVRNRGVLEMGTPDRPIPSSVTAEIRLVVPAGTTFQGGDFAPGDVGIWIFEGGRWDVAGAPIRHTWTKLARPVGPGDLAVVVRADVTDWSAGATVLVTPTGRSPEAADFEERTVEGVRRLPKGLYEVRLRSALARAHDGGGHFSGEIALLSRNARILSKYPDRVKAHTMYMAGANGGISYAELRDLGARGVLGRYPVHFHMMGDTSRGMVLRGASIWRSDNHFLNIHGSSGITVEDTVGYDVPGAGFFLEAASGRSGGQESLRSTQDKRVRREEERERRASESRRKGEEPFGNVDNIFIHNLGAKAVWRPGALEERTRVSLFWIGAFNTILIDNVAVGAVGGRDFSGFHLAENADHSLSRLPLAMVGNEAHSNGAHGLFSWTNSKLAFDIVGFSAWRNGRSGVALGAYNHRFRLFNAALSENGLHNVGTWVIRPWIQDSVLQASPVGIFFYPREVPGSPE